MVEPFPASRVENLGPTPMSHAVVKIGANLLGAMDGTIVQVALAKEPGRFGGAFFGVKPGVIRFIPTPCGACFDLVSGQTRRTE